jgi:hypothetical protein
MVVLSHHVSPLSLSAVEDVVVILYYKEQSGAAHHTGNSKNLQFSGFLQKYI